MNDLERWLLVSQTLENVNETVKILAEQVNALKAQVELQEKRSKALTGLVDEMVIILKRLKTEKEGSKNRFGSFL